MKHRIIKTLIVIIAILHIIEEYYGGFIPFVSNIVPGITLSHFLFINALFILYVVVALISDKQILVLSVPLLLMVNAAIHIISSMVFWAYSPGVITSVFLYVPVSVCFIKYLNPYRKTVFQSLMLSVVLMAFPLIFQLVRVMVNRA
jgi:hypothetical protein